MKEQIAQNLIENLTVKIKEITQNSDSQYASNILGKIVDNLKFDLDPFVGETSLQNGTITLPIDKKKLEIVANNNNEEVAFSYVFLHEFGHQVQQFLPLSKEHVDIAVKAFEEFREYGFTMENIIPPASFLSNQEFEHSLFKNPVVNDFYLKLRAATDYYDQTEDNYGFSPNFKPFVVKNEDELEILHKHGMQMEKILGEQFADCFALSVIHNLYPEHYEKTINSVIKSRKEGEAKNNYYTGSNLEDYGFVHRTSAALVDLHKAIKSNPDSTKNLDNMIDLIYPIIEKNTALSMKEIMNEDKTLVYFPKAVNEVIESVMTKDFTITKTGLMARIKESKDKENETQNSVVSSLKVR